MAARDQSICSAPSNSASSNPCSSGQTPASVLEASFGAAAEVEERRRQVTRHWEQRVERARYDAERAARQYRPREPEDRLVARAPERRWGEALRAVQRSEAEFDRFLRAQPRPLGEAERGQIRRPAAEVPALWHAPTTMPADRRQVVRLLIDRVVLTVEPGDDRITARVERAGGAARAHAVRGDVHGYRHRPGWPVSSARLAELHGLGETPRAIAVALDRGGFRPPKRASLLTAGVVRRLLHEWGLRPRVPRCESDAGPLSPGEWWLHDLARHRGLSPHTLPGWRKKGRLHVRQAGGRGGPWAVWAGAAELDRVRALRECPRLGAHRERLAALRVPGPRPE